jgi:hypothetical protein
MHNLLYVEHPGYQKTITIVIDQYFCPGLKKYVTDYLARCMECKKVKTEHKHLVRLLQPLPIPKWKWEFVTINFTTKLARKHDSIMTVVDKIANDICFILVKETHMTTNIAKIYMREISRLHGVPKEIVSDRDPKFTSNFWKWLSKGFGTNLNFITSYHLEPDGKTKRINRIIEDILRMHVMEKPSRWEDYIYLVDFSYNNGYQDY